MVFLTGGQATYFSWFSGIRSSRSRFVHRVEPGLDRLTARFVQGAIATLSVGLLVIVGLAVVATPALDLDRVGFGNPALDAVLVAFACGAALAALAVRFQMSRTGRASFREPAATLALATSRSMRWNAAWCLAFVDVAAGLHLLDRADASANAPVVASGSLVAIGFAALFAARIAQIGWVAARSPPDG